MSMFTLDISCLTTSNLPWFVDLAFQFPMQYCCLQHQTLLPSPVTSTTWVLFLLWLHLFLLSGVVILLFSSSILGTYWPGEFIFQCHVFFAFSFVHGVPKARICKCFVISFSSGLRFVRSVHNDPSALGGHTWHDSQFHWVRQGFGPCENFDIVLWLWFSFCLPSEW